MPKPLSHPAKLRSGQTVPAVVLTLVAGYVDAIGFLRLGGVYVANMSGNSVSVGIHAAHGSWSTVAERLLTIGMYVLSLLLTRMVVDAALERGFRRIVACCLLLEGGFLIVFRTSAGHNAGIVLGAAAMGIQAATLSKFSDVTIYTAFVTGSLVKFAESAAEWVMGWWKGDPAIRKQAGDDSIWFMGVWAAYVVGAVGGAAGFERTGVAAVTWAVAALGGIALIDVFRPAKFDPEV